MCEIKIGLLSTGCYKNWSVDLDEHSKGSEFRYGIIIDRPGLYLQFLTKDFKLLYKLVGFINEAKDRSDYTVDIENGELIFAYYESRLKITYLIEDGFGSSNMFQVYIFDEEIKGLALAIQDALNDL